VMLAVMFLAFVAGVIGMVSAFGRIANPARYYTVRDLVVVVIVISLFAAIVVPVLQPTLFNYSNPSGICSGSGGNQTPCNSFWGSLSGSGETLNWGSDVGWYLAVATAVLLISAVFVWRSSSSEPWGRGPATSPTAPAMSPGVAGYPPGLGTVALSPSYLGAAPGVQQPSQFPQPSGAPQQTRVVPSEAGPATWARYCPSCGMGNMRAAGFCQKCGKPLPSPP
jgi:hypothetical protein